MLEDYTLWISSDALADLSISIGANPVQARFIAAVPPWGLFTGLFAIVIIGYIIRLQYIKYHFAHQQKTQVEFARAMLESQESERRRIAANLHDSLGQELLVIRNQASRALQANPPDPVLRQRLMEISNTTLQALEEVREITHNLRPHQLDRLDLTQAIRALIRKISETSYVEFASSVDSIDKIFDIESETHIYRIIQEAMNNIVKHSEASEATIVIRKDERKLSISVRDNGIGFTSKEGSNFGFGLTGILERVKILNGLVKIESFPGEGSTLKVEIPLKQTLNCYKKEISLNGGFFKVFEPRNAVV